MSEVQFRTESSVPAENALLDCFDLFRQRAQSITDRLTSEGIQTFGDLVVARRRLKRILDSANLKLVADFLEHRGYPIPAAQEI